MRVVACGTYLCRVDYNCDIQFCEVFKKEHSRRMTYLILPVVAHCFRKACMDMYRNICVVEDEDIIKLKFVDVTSSHSYIFRPPP
jgi:hypothetical protein